MRILIGSLTYPLPNGVTSSIDESVDGFLAAGHQVKILSPDYGTGSARPEHEPILSSTIGEVLGLFLGKKERMFAIGANRLIRRAIQQFYPDAFWLHTVTWAPNAFEKEMLRTNIPKVLSYHTMIDLYGKLYAGAIGEREMITRSETVCNSVDQVITPSRYMKKRLLEFGVKTPVTVIPTGITPVSQYHTKEFLAAKYHFSPTDPVLIYVGRVVKEKNIEALLVMMQGVVAKLPTARLVLVGPGDIVENRARAKELGIAKNVIFTNQLKANEARQYYGSADVFVFASQSETQGLVLGEAMVAGVPIVALSSPIQPEFYPDDVTMVVRKPADFPAAVLAMLKSKTRRQQYAKLGRQFIADNFTLEKTLHKQIDLFTELVGPRTATKLAPALETSIL